MKILAEPFWVQKRGCSPEEYEDAACPLRRCEYEQSCIRFAVAVADGATESIFAKRWAEQLVVAVGDGDLSPRSLSKGIARLRAGWHEWLAGKTLPWFAEEKARQGSFAALVVLWLTAEGASEDASEAPEWWWHAAAVGDSCLFHIRGEEVLDRFPLTSPEAFDSRPYLLSSVGAHEEELNEETLSGTWKKGDVFYLMTDALACWFLKHIAAGGSPSNLRSNFASTNGTEAFRAWVDSLRDQGSIRNDDCTLICVEIR